MKTTTTAKRSRTHWFCTADGCRCIKTVAGDRVPRGWALAPDGSPYCPTHRGDRPKFQPLVPCPQCLAARVEPGRLCNHCQKEGPK